MYLLFCYADDFPMISPVLCFYLHFLFGLQPVKAEERPLEFGYRRGFLARRCCNFTRSGRASVGLSPLIAQSASRSLRT